MMHSENYDHTERMGAQVRRLPIYVPIKYLFIYFFYFIAFLLSWIRYVVIRTE